VGVPELFVTPILKGLVGLQRLSRVAVTIPQPKSVVAVDALEPFGTAPRAPKMMMAAR
jgi:hypothetical protein